MRTLRGVLRELAAVIGAAVMTSCGDASAPGLNPVDFLLADADGSWGDAAAAAMAVAWTPSAPMPVDADACKYSYAKDAFACPPREWNHMTFALSYQLLDATGSSLDTYDAGKVAALRTTTSVTGTRYISATTSQIIASTGERTMSGLLTGEPTIDGTESATFVLMAGSFSDTVYVASTTTGLKVPRSEAEFPSGVIMTSYYTAPPQADAAPDGTFTISFDGSRFSALVWSFSGFSAMCTFDLKKEIKTNCTR